MSLFDGDRFSGKLFGSHVGRGAASHVLDLVGDARQAKVRDQDLATAIEHDIGWLQVAMQDPLVMGRRNSRANLTGNFGGLVAGQTPDAPQQ